MLLRELPWRGQCLSYFGEVCDDGDDCRGGFECGNAAAGTLTCGSCLTVTGSCSDKSQCCFSDCTEGKCLSMKNNPCTVNEDCFVCFEEGDFDGVCRFKCIR